MSSASRAATAATSPPHTIHFFWAWLGKGSLRLCPGLYQTRWLSGSLHGMGSRWSWELEVANICAQTEGHRRGETPLLTITPVALWHETGFFGTWKLWTCRSVSRLSIIFRRFRGFLQFLTTDQRWRGPSPFSPPCTLQRYHLSIFSLPPLPCRPLPRFVPSLILRIIYKIPLFNFQETVNKIYSLSFLYIYLVFK